MIRLQPDEGLRLYLLAKEPGPGSIRLRPVSLDLGFAELFQTHVPDGYERLLIWPGQRRLVLARMPG